MPRWATGTILDTKTVGTGGTIVMAQGMLYLVDNRPSVTLFRPTPTGLEQVSTFAHDLGTTHQLYTHAVIADGRLVLRHQNDVAIHDLRRDKPCLSPAPHLTPDDPPMCTCQNDPAAPSPSRPRHAW
jgi:hypothetical protein